MGTRGSGTLGVALLLLGGSASAEPAADPCVAANAGYDEASRLVLAQKLGDVEALDRFTQVNNDCPQPRAVAQMGLAEARMKRWADARRHLKEALSAKEDADVNRERATLSGYLNRVEEQLGRVKVLGGARGAKVKLDGVPSGSLPFDEPLYVMPGKHRIEVTHPDAPGFAHEFDVAAQQMVTVEAPVPPPKPLVVTVPEPKPTPLRKKLGIAGIAVGGALLVGGIIAATQWNPVIGHWNTGCLVPVNMTRAMNCPDGSRDVLLVESFTYGGLIVGGALTAASVVALAWPDKEKASPARVTFRLLPGPGQLGLAATGTF